VEGRTRLDYLERTLVEVFDAQPSSVEEVRESMAESARRLAQEAKEQGLRGHFVENYREAWNKRQTGLSTDEFYALVLRAVEGDFEPLWDAIEKTEHAANAFQQDPTRRAATRTRLEEALNAPRRPKRKWQQVLADIVQAHVEDTDAEPEFDMYLDRRGAYSFRVLAIDGAFVGRVSEKMLSEIRTLEERGYAEGLQDGYHADAWRSAVQRVRQNEGLVVPLNTLATAILVPTKAPTRKTVTMNVYQSLFVDTRGFAALLPEPLSTRLLKALDGGEVKARATMIEVHDTISPLPGLSGLVRQEDETEGDTKAIPEVTSRNLIFFGPPGTGKSYRLSQRARQALQAEGRIIRVTFHPEYAYHDFIGSFRPTVGWLQATAKFQLKDGQEKNAEPRVYYTFNPGPLAETLVSAVTDPSKHWVLAIEEINRGNCAAIFGDFFQLLDRGGERERPETYGTSTYSIRPMTELAEWLDEKLGNKWPEWKEGRLRLPKNLFLWATMNTSDQGLFPMDTAFKRRWAMEYMGVVPPSILPTKVPLHAGDTDGIPWSRFINVVNAIIVDHTRSDDKQMGPWFVQADRGHRLVDEVQFRSKVLFYLWSDVFRGNPARLFREDVRTYDQLVSRFEDGKHVLRRDVLEGLEVGGLETAPRAPGLGEE